MTDFIGQPVIGLSHRLEESGVACLSAEPLSRHCTFKTGGAAALLVLPKNAAELKTALDAVKCAGVKHFILGKGSNVLFSDAGYDGVVIKLAGAFSGARLLDGDRIWAGSGMPLLELCRFACENGLTGLEFAYGIPGSVGGAVYMNAGAYGGEIRDVIESATHIDADGNEGGFDAQGLALSYRHSVYSDNGGIITGAVFRLQKGDKGAIRSRMNEIMARRTEKQPLDYPSAGSTFKRPEGAYASALIDQCGLKGLCVGGAMVSEKHAGFVINAGGATSADIVALIQLVKDRVKSETGFALECEVRMIG